MARIRRSKTNTTFFMDIPKNKDGSRYRRTECKRRSIITEFKTKLEEIDEQI